MRRYGMVMAIGLLVLVNIVVLGGAAFNRSGEPDAEVTLTERELPLSSYYSYADRENTGLSLRLNWSQRVFWNAVGERTERRQRRQSEWFDRAKLESIGFDCTPPLDDPRAALHYQKLLPRKTFAVLEYEGSAWEAWRANEQDDLAKMEQQTSRGDVSRKELREAREEFERQLRTRSRLFAVDVGNDPGALRKKYGDRTRFLILPASVRLLYSRPEDENGRRSPPSVEGMIDEVLVDEICVPKEHRVVLEGLLRSARQRGGDDYGPYSSRKRTPSYAVMLRVGKRHEPWIAGVRLLAPKR